MYEEKETNNKTIHFGRRVEDYNQSIVQHKLIILD